MSNSPLPAPVCSLEARSFNERLKWIAALNERSLRHYRRTARTLTLTYDVAALQQVEELMQRERECCSFLEFELTQDTALELTIRVPAHIADTGNSDPLLAPFYDPDSVVDNNSCCGTCETPAPSIRKGHPAGVAIATSVAAVLACGAGCIIPLAIPAITATAAGGVLAWLGRSHAWITSFAVFVVVMAWLWIWRQTAKRGMRPTRTAIALMSAASLIALLAILWPYVEPSLVAVLVS